MFNRGSSYPKSDYSIVPVRSASNAAPAVPPVVVKPVEKPSYVVGVSVRQAA